VNAAFGRTHDLDELTADREWTDLSLHGFLDSANEVTVFAWRFRCPGEPPEPDPEDARAALGAARVVLQVVLARIPGGAGSPPNLWVNRPGHSRAGISPPPGVRDLRRVRLLGSQVSGAVSRLDTFLRSLVDSELPTQGGVSAEHDPPGVDCR
jgi:hypothetical protein